jgi:hypothetical protein
MCTLPDPVLHFDYQMFRYGFIILELFVLGKSSRMHNQEKDSTLFDKPAGYGIGNGWFASVHRTSTYHKDWHSEDPMPTYSRIRERRHALGLSQEDLATRLRAILPIHHRRMFNKSVVSVIESGLRELYVDELPYFAKALECSPLDLLDPLE